MHLSGIKLPPVGSIQDGIFRSVFLRQRVRELRDSTLMLLAQGGKADAVSEIFRDHYEDILYLEGVRKAEEKSLMDKYEEIRHERPILSRDRDGTLKVTGLQ